MKLVGLLRHSLILGVLVGVSSPGLLGQNQTIGHWSTASYTMPINPIHAALLSNGKILVVAGSGNCPASQGGCPQGSPYGSGNGSGALLLNPSNGSINRFNLPWDMFCNGMVVLPDGRAFINGGTLQYDPFFGQPKSAIFDPATNTFTDTPNMAHGRWYPTVTTLGDGRVMTFSGDDEHGNTNTTVEIYTVGSGWSQPSPAGWTPPLYPRMHLLPNGQVFYSGQGPNSALFNPSNTSWSQNVATTVYGGQRTYGTSVLLPLNPSNGYDPQVMIMGGGSPATATTEIIDLGVGSPKWKSGPSMSQARTEMNAVILPNGKVLAMGGSVNDEDTGSLSLNADLYDPVAKTFSSAGANAFARLYHSVALLLPDATVWLTGGNPVRGSFESHVEIYQPAYLFNSSGGLATRPTITSAPSSVDWGNGFTVQTPDAANISSVVLVRDGAVTHAFDMDQRLVGLSFTASGSSLMVTAPPNGNIAPPGYYMLFVLNNSGVPSVAKFIQLIAGGGGNPAPTLSSISPTSGTTLGGTAVTVAGTGFMAGATLTLGGTSASNVTAVNSTTITATTGAHAAGAVDLVVSNTDGQSATLTQGFTYTAVSNPAPTVTAISPNSGSTSGGTLVSITGTGFLAGATVSLGGTTAMGVTVVSSTSITATTTAHGAGAVDVVVTNSDSQSGTLPQGFTYTAVSNPAPTVTAISPNSGPVSGGTAVTITGTGFAAGQTVILGGTPATGVTVVSSTSITAITPARAAGVVNVVVSNAEQHSGTLTNGYTYVSSPANPAPTVTSIIPTSGTTDGGTGVTVMGTGFLPGATLSLGESAATGITVVSGTSITAITPSHLAGAVDVVVTNTDTQQAMLSGDFTYSSSLPSLGLLVPPGDSNSATVVAGQPASYALSIGGSGVGGTASFSCTGAPKGANCAVPASQSFNSTAPSTFTVSVTTTARTVGALSLRSFSPATWLWTFTMLGIVSLSGLRGPNQTLRKSLRLAPLTVLLLLGSCGGGSTPAPTPNPNPNANGTPAGTYTLNLTATSGTTSQAATLTLVVK